MTSDRGPLSLINRSARHIGQLQSWQRYLTAFGFGALTATALAPLYILPALFVGMSCLIWLMDSTRSGRRPHWAAFVTGTAFGFGYFLFSLRWLANAFLVQADAFGWMIPIAIPLLTAFLGLFFGLALLAASPLWRFNLSRVFLLPLTISLFEYARGHILTGFPWNLIGQSFAGTALTAQLAAWIGPYGLSLVVLIIASLPAVAFSRAHVNLKPLAGAVGGVIALLGFGAIRLATAANELTDVDVVIVQPNVPQIDKFDPDKRDAIFQRTVRLTQDAASLERTTYAVWPENAEPYLAQAIDASRYFGSALPTGTTLIAGTFRYYRDETETIRYGNSAVVFGETVEGEKPLLAIYDKHHLVPFGEYLPLKGLLTALGLSQLAPVDDGFTPGIGPRTLSIGPHPFAPLICYEDVFPRQLYPSDQRPEWLVVMTNDAWFGDNAGPRQHLDISRLRAIESGLPMARSANTGISALIDPYGRIVESLPLYEAGAITKTLPRSISRTPYDRLGSIPYIGLLALVVLLCWFTGLRRSENRIY
ncbi:apolipoprotein N-acyltransferase [Parvularcula sp. LCG005]|uniref:apolipoprotein N-acyltransferase n=1 Tax=Parvularcula sp. LCG005 TaxID=3078805 RepID=UPI002942B276|nr:apolipoprotein N-acyltransferase [Parvularcula sp. LCG005]WOI53347.1 apolipoprotein N-acyltransferase [Parvularcula sp. LCG005]